MNVRKNKFKIGLIGQVSPYRGGISQYNTQLHRALRHIVTPVTVSFDKLYPQFLYPGESDTEAGAKDWKEPGVEYLIHVYKPWTLLKSTSRMKAEGAEVVFLTWWTLIWQPGMAFLAWLLSRKGIKVVYICHNVFDHDGKGLKKHISKYLLKYADGFVVHSTGDERALKEIYDKPILNTKVLPVYDQYPVAIQAAPKRGKLEILFFGFIRPYKGLDDLIEALAKLNNPNIYLTIVGEPWIKPAELNSKIKQFKAPNVETHLKYVDKDQAAFYFSRADLVAIPYRHDTASAVASLAFNYRKPLLGSRVQGIKDIIEDNITGWLIEPGSPESIAKKIKNISRGDTERMKPNIEKFCKENSWDNLAKNISEFAQGLASN